MSKFFRAALVAGLSASCLTPIWSQERELPIDRVPSKLSGIRVRSAWLGGGWYEINQPSPSGIVKTNLALGSAGAAFNWTNNSDRTSSWANYAGEFNRANKNSDLDSVNQGFDFGFFRRLVPRWTWRTSGEGEFLNFGSRLFRFPGGGSTLRTGENAASRITGPSLNDPSLVSFGRGAFDATSLLVGGDFYRLAANSSLSFAQSARSSWSFSGTGAQTTYKSQNTPANQFLPLRRVYNATLTGGWRYNLNPRTALTWEANGGRTWAGFSSTGQEQYNNAQTTVQIARAFTTHWFASAGAGISASESFTTTVTSTPWFVTYLATGGVGYIRNDQNLQIQATHSSGDAYGFGAQENDQATFTYTYRPLGSAWGLNLAAIYQRLVISGLPNVDGWVGMAGVTRRVTRNTFLLVEVARTTNVAFTAGRLVPVGASRSTLDSLGQQAVRVSFVYQPMLQVSR